METTISLFATSLGDTEVKDAVARMPALLAFC